MEVHIDFATGAFPNFKIIESFTYNGNHNNFQYLFNHFSKYYNLNDSCYCKLKLFSKKKIHMNF